jgi:hypothetical protein
MTIDAFLSYARSDRDMVAPVHDALNACGLDVWMDERRLSPDLPWREEVVAGIRGARAVIVAVTPRSRSSQACRQELTIARVERKPLLALILEAAEPPFDAVVVDSVDDLAARLC